MSSDGEEDREALLNALQAHGQRFLDAFGDHAKQLKSLNDRARSESPTTTNSKRKLPEEWDDDTAGDDESEEDEWNGIEDPPESPPAKTSHVELDYSKPLRGDLSKKIKASKKGFMSSKVGKLKADDTDSPDGSAGKSKSLDDEEKSNMANDTLLHRLIHTQLLSSNLEPDLNISGAQRRKALEGRIDELVGSSKLGKGETRVRREEHNRASKSVRDGLQEKRKHKGKKQLEVAKELGNYHPSLKTLYKGDDEDKRPRSKRERGLGMGVGKFAGGVLRLSRKEIQSVQDPSATSRDKGGKRRKRSSIG